MKSHRCLFSFLAASIFLSSPAAAEEGKGFFFRSMIGPGHSWAHAEQTEHQPDVDMQAWTLGLMLSPGYEFLPGLAVHGDVYGAMLFAHQLKPDTDTEVYVPDQVGIVEFILGAGITYRPLPGSLYVSGGLGFSEVWGSRWQYTGDIGNSDLDTKTAASYPGYALYGSVGKLFDVHKRWSLGGALNYNFKSVGRPGENDLTVGRVHSLWLGFVAAYHPKR